MTWLSENLEWLFSGAGLAVLGVASIWVRRGFARWRESRGYGPMSEDQSVARARVASKPLQRLVPGLLLRTLLKPDDIARQVLVGLRDDAPGGAILSAEIPHVDLYFQITNLSPVDLILDRMLVDVWFGQPTFSVTMLHRYPVPAGEVTHGLHVRQMLAENQRTQVETFSAQAGQGNRLHIYITAYFESKLGRFFIQRSIERSGL